MPIANLFDFLLSYQFELVVMEQRLADYKQYMPEKQVLDLSAMVLAPMPGMVKAVGVSEGQHVSLAQRNLSFN